MAERTIERIWEVARIPTEVVVVDNGSPCSAELAARVYRFEKTAASRPGWNTGIALAAAPVVAVLNSDCRVEPGWDEALYEAATDGRRIAFPYTDHCDGLGLPPARPGGHGGLVLHAHAERSTTRSAPFDEWFNPAFCEDTDYWHRAWELGIELSPVPAAHGHASAPHDAPNARADWLLIGHRYKYGWKHGVDPIAPRRTTTATSSSIDGAGLRTAPEGRRARNPEPTPRPARVFGIGLNKTGTSSFHEAMTISRLHSLHWGGPERAALIRRVGAERSRCFTPRSALRRLLRHRRSRTASTCSTASTPAVGSC